MNKIAVFFDAENVSPKIVPDIIAELSSKGEILFQRAYADWSIGNTKGWQEQITKTPITVYQQFHNGETQVIDKAIMMDAVELAIKHEDITTLAIVASDNGYYSLALRLRELGKQVIGLGEKEKCQPIWVKACNEFIYFSDLKEIDDDILLDEKDLEENSDIGEIALLQFLDQAYDATPLYENKNVVLGSRLGDSIRSFKPDFKYSDYKARGLRDMLARYPEHFIITDDGKPQPTYYVERIEEKEIKSDVRKEGTITRWIGNFGIISDPEGKDYFFYTKEILPSSREKKIRKNVPVTFIVSREPDPNATTTKEKNGNAKEIEIIG